MTLPPFDLHRAGSVEEARELLLRHGDDAAIVCGGTELLLLLKLGFAAYGHLIDISRIDGQVRDSSIKKVGEVVTAHPEEALAIIRTWLHQPV